jgi:hypothetical protein
VWVSDAPRLGDLAVEGSGVPRISTSRSGAITVEVDRGLVLTHREMVGTER